ncbi:Stp1/IreP family PP2C-type Ser/Thr phosphatase [Dictyobacter aurantiacus]|uniref:PPM-type phosphatase domain-containing protein n=1 Tax=Dictyobacter aurantiacus TaxID=1936993 RepID=A0A401ZAD1_9CHLR|nr:Stp1/IreP family PP2C-type Ser/Thr phosphatase [Dictyobacter aurantiacus]GCE03783.1 hypothetical protein KDAU_11120 [Dictyobacter aurantiacus]
MSKQLRLDVAQLTDVGRKRPHNEDNMAYVIPRDSQVMAKKGALFIVADGMGGHAAGEVASEIAVDTVSNVYYQDEADDIPLSLMNAIKRANALIHQRAAENMMRSGMGTTCVAAVLRGGVAYIANVGDSRAYMVRHGQAKQISQDHSWVEEQVRAGLLTKDQARSHAQRNVITRALGTQAEVEVDVFTELLEDGDTFVLCSDGLSGPVGEEDLRAIVNQYMPQESVYHLVERANENGGADNITAIVVRVMEAGDDVPAALQHPVHVGGGNHVADESTAVLGRVPSSSLGVSTPPRVEDGRINSRPLPPPVEPAFISSKGYTAPHAAVNVPRRKRNRLLLPTIVVAVLLLVALAGAGAWYFLKPSAVQTTLNNADALISQAKSKISSQPDQALSNLTQAQQELRSLKGASLNPQQSDQLTSLQNNLTSEFKTALTNYNQRSLAVGLPCVNQAPVTLNASGADIQTSSLATLQTDKDHTINYVLGLDGAVYQVNDQHTLQKVSLGNDKIILLTSDNQYLYTLTSAQPSANYHLHAYKWQNNKLTEKVNNGTAIKPEMITNQTPLLLTAWAGEVYVILASSQANQNQATLLNYNVDKLDKDPATTQISISAGLVSAAALPNGQLFFLHSDGKIASLQANSPKALEAGVLVQQTVNTPWFQDAQSFNVATPVATPTAPISKFLSIPPPTAQTRQSLLSVGMVNNTAHLFVVDNTNHRVLNFVVKAPNSVVAAATPTASATANSRGGGVIAPDSNLPSASLEQQYVSSTLVSDVKGTAFDARANHINLLAAAPNSAATNQIAIDVSSTTACRPNP